MIDLIVNLLFMLTWSDVLYVLGLLAYMQAMPHEPPKEIEVRI